MNFLQVCSTEQVTPSSGQSIEYMLNIYVVERGSSAVKSRTRNQVSPGSNPALLPCRRLGIFVLSIDVFTQLYK